MASTVTPYLCCKDASAAIDWYTQALGAVETSRLAMPDGKIGHAEISIDGATVMLSDEWPEGNVFSPQTIGGTSILLALEVENCDGVYDRAIKAGATSERAPEDQFYGHRTATFLDPSGHRWSIHHVIEEVSNDEMKRRMEEYSQQQG